MDSISVSTNFEFPDNSLIGESSGNFSVRKKLEGRKELRKSLRISQKQNIELKEQVTKQSTEIAELTQTVKSLNEIIEVTSKNTKNETQVTNAASTKIVDLCRRNRQLKAELELMKSKYLKIDTKLLKLEKEISTDSETNKSNSKNKKITCCHSATSIDSLQEQLSSTKQKLFDTLNINAELKNNLKLAQKCLQQEIGESVNLNSITNSNSNWRGRAQQIISLQNKVAELKERLEFYQSPNSILADDPCRVPIRKIEASRKAELDELQNQVKQMQITIDQQNSKISALKARNKNLVDDAMNYKLKTLNLMEQSDASDNSIAAISEKISIQKYHYEHQIKQFQTELAEYKKLYNDIKFANQQSHIQIKEAYAIVEAKEKEIIQLNLEKARQEEELKSICGDFLFSCRDLKKSEFLGILDSLESEKNGLIKLNEELNNKLIKNEEKVKAQLEKISKYKIKISRLESKIREHNKEIEAQHDKRKRNQRMADYSNNLSNRLSVTGMVFENSTNSFDLISSLDKQNQVKLTPPKLDEMKNKIEFCNDKIEFLEEKLKILRREKDEDFKLFNNIMKNSKDILLKIVKQNNNDDSTSIKYGMDSDINNDDCGQNNYNEKLEDENLDNDSDSLENYHINVNYRDNDSVSNPIINSTTKLPSFISSFTSMDKIENNFV